MPPICVYQFICHCNCAAWSNMTIVWPSRSTTPWSRQEGKQRSYTWFLWVLADNLYARCPSAIIIIFNRSTLHACYPLMMQNLTSANTKQSLGLFSNTIQCWEEGYSIDCQIGSANYSVWESLQSWWRWLYDWPSFCETDQRQSRCIFCSSWVLFSFHIHCLSNLSSSILSL